MFLRFSEAFLHQVGIVRQVEIVVPDKAFDQRLLLGRAVPGGRSEDPAVAPLPPFGRRGVGLPVARELK